MDELSSDDAFELGNQFRDAAIALGDWRQHRGSLNKAEWDEPDSQGILLLNTVSSLYTSAMGLVLVDGQHAMKRLRMSVKEAKAAVKHINALKQALDLASPPVFQSGAVYSGNAASIPSTIVALEDATEAVVSGTDSQSAWRFHAAIRLK
ncbi:hypothetical protein SAMN05216403_107111 [Nitrosospira multiformis ATCC 25196]|uniref:Uncharacterized protein n=1 Tax=Nitrosospira multiformis (strain ATCC 25196 / NCIMB 11849 / C 71) TaxID=323848 RepID=Q2Y945_NITMU|nr:hypothetical protein [Nitrosospira multiformis]ABB74726.1 hypothetical protein Nmul_A1423 [Nitrosospira multiformis ATCC 25196]SEF74064.1 hypothetical protein SAMN05216403_107111 [Nitrosospira multiformis ATCC 25196]